MTDEATKPKRAHRRTRPVPQSPDVAALLDRIEALEAGKLRTIETQPEPRAEARVSAPLYDSPFLNKLLEGTHPVPEDFGGDVEPSYNVPLRLFAKPDGEIVALQGDARSRAFYQEKGFRLLSKDEQAHYEQVERPRILQAQRQKAHLITVIRNMFRREPSLIGWRDDPDFDSSLNLMSIEQLREQFDDLRLHSANPNQKLPALPRFRSDETQDKLLTGVDTTPTKAAADIRPAARSRDIEVLPNTINTFR
jgi:hypothetical protein